MKLTTILLILTIFSAALSNTCTKPNLDSNFPGFDNAYETMYEKFIENLNISNSGGVVSSPDYDTPGGSYHYHFMRDAAIAMKSYMIINDFQIEKILSTMDRYFNWVGARQRGMNPHGYWVYTEPKFNVPQGYIYSGPMCRPQTDGPGLRATTIIAYAKALLDANVQVEKTVWGKLWRSNGYGVIQMDLNFINDHWKEYGCDLWGETRSNEFFWNQMSLHQALTLGAEFATIANDFNAQKKYASTAEEIKKALLNHYNGEIIFQSSNRYADSSVIHALGLLNEGVFDITGVETANTIKYLNKLFCEEYQINQDQDQQGIPGILYGRYQGDTYAGGNPWQLLTASLAELFYQISEKMEARGNQILGNEQIQAWKDVLEFGDASQVSAQEFAQLARKAGHAVMYRLWTHVSTGYDQITEQIDRNTGEQLGAKNLTWSYANILRILHTHVQKKSDSSVIY